MSDRSIVYIDGFNLYYGSLRGTDYRWLNLQRLFERLRPDDDIQVIRYFTAQVDGRAQARQATYLRAIATLPKVEVILGLFKSKRFKCRVRDCDFEGGRFYVGWEEKRTDVAMGVALVDDAHRNVADRFIIVSGDSDLVPAMRMLKSRYPEKRVHVYIPSRNEIRGAATEIRGEADRSRTLPMALVKKSLLSNEVPDGPVSISRTSPPCVWASSRAMASPSPDPPGVSEAENEIHSIPR